MNAEKFAELPVYSGISFDPATGKSYTSDGVDTGFTFERATWTGPFGLVINWPWLNPISFATHDTGEKVLQFAKKAAPRDLKVTLDEAQRVVGPFTRTVERQIVVSNGQSEENFSAGWMASSIIRHGEKRAAELWAAELKQAGLLN